MKIESLVAYEAIRKLSRQITRYGRSHFWTIDRGRSAYLIRLIGAGSPDDLGRMAFSVMVYGNQVVLFNEVVIREGNAQLGINENIEIHKIHIPQNLENRIDEIKVLIKDAYEELVYFSPFANGGTIANPNIQARKNIVSIEVVFK